ncbi:MAG: aldo/keto reductase [Bacteroidales bacterium]|nr:aldo/keto reductase [Bacteroidales bacterium]
MRVSAFGNTGLQVSTLGFGCMRLPVIDQDNSRIDEEQAMEMIHCAIDRGVNYFDTAYPYHAFDFSKGGASEPFLAKALGNGYREKVYVATKLPSWLVQTREDMDRYLDEQLERLETAYIDFYLLHGLDESYWRKLLSLGVLEFLNSALEAGKIRYAGFSYHDEAGLFKEIVDAYDWTFCQIQYNYMDEEYQAGAEGLKYAAERGLAVVVMEPLRGGTLVSGLPIAARKEFEKAAPGRSPVEWALHWLWKQPEVSVVLSGMSHLDQLKENLQLSDEFTQKEWTSRDDEALQRAVGLIRGLKRVDCTACSYCMPCPEGVNIPRNFALYNDFHMLHDPAARLRYTRLLSDTAKASNCIQCGLCEPQCPQGIPIRAELEHVAELFGSE